MKDDLAKALNGVWVLQQWQNQLLQSALQQLGTGSPKRSSSREHGESRHKGGPGKGAKSR
jgi:hypothetical protein